MIATIDEVLDDKVFDRVSFCDIRLLRLFHDYGGFEGRSDIDCIMGWLEVAALLTVVDHWALSMTSKIPCRRMTNES